MANQESTLALALQIHGKLSEVVAPANPDSIRASRFRDNGVLRFIIYFGLACFGLFLVVIAWPPEQEWPNYNLLDHLQVFAAAGLGSSFQALITANRYLKDQTFDPTYKQFYIVRLMIGVFAGVILAVFSDDLLQLDEDTKTISKSGLALVGGFSADGVAQILKRFSETLVSLVRGSGRETAQAEAKQDAAKKNAKVVSDLQAAAESASQDEMKEKIAKIVKGLLK